jgi:hypothetical protein
MLGLCGVAVFCRFVYDVGCISWVFCAACGTYIIEYHRCMLFSLGLCTCDCVIRFLVL